MTKRRHKRGKPWKAKPPAEVGTVTGRFTKTDPEPYMALPWKPGMTNEGMPVVVGVDFGATEARSIAHYVAIPPRGGKMEINIAARQAGKTLAGYAQALELGAGKATRIGHDWSHVPIEPLGAGVSRILSRGSAEPVRYPWGG